MVMWSSFMQEYFKPDELAEWKAICSEIDQLTQRRKFLERRAEARRERGPSKREIAGLRAAMVAAHPDKGGSAEAFVEANRRYRQAVEEARWARG
jgi:hypothetical protein